MDKKYWEVGLHTIFWILTAWLLASSFSIVSLEVEEFDGEEAVTAIRDQGLVLQLLATVIFSAVLSYLTISQCLRYPLGRQITLLIRNAFLFLIFFLVVYVIVNIYLLPREIAVVPLNLGVGIVLFYFAAAMAYSIGKIWTRTELMRRQLAFEKKETELNLLRNQLQPHFLFNALNNLLAMVDQAEHPVLAHSIDRLSRLLRYIVDDVGSGLVPVHKEVEFVRHYAAIQQLRFEKEEISFTLECTGDHREQLVEPGLFLPFVENAFKYGAAPEEISSIVVAFDLTAPDTIRFSASNPIYEMMRSEFTGTGIAAARSRLDLVYPGKYGLQIREDDLYAVTLDIRTA